MFLSCRRSPLLLSSTILRRTHLWLPYPQHMLFFLYWSVSLFCILNLRPHQTQLASSIAALRAARWRACACVVGRVVCYKDEVLRHKLDHISFNRPLLFFISKESFNYDLFIRSVFVFCLSRRHRDTHVCACIHTHTLLVSGYWLPGWVQESPLCGVVVDDSENNGADIQMSIQLCQQRVTFVWRTRVPNCTLLILNLYLHNSVDE